jgi:hypothetical protein
MPFYCCGDLVSAMTVQARVAQGFDCIPKYLCYCTGGRDSADCKGMIRNCVNQDSGHLVCEATGRCHCEAVRAKPKKPPRIQVPDDAGSKKPPRIQVP